MKPYLDSLDPSVIVLILLIKKKVNMIEAQTKQTAGH